MSGRGRVSRGECSAPPLPYWPCTGNEARLLIEPLLSLPTPLRLHIINHPNMPATAIVNLSSFKVPGTRHKANGNTGLVALKDTSVKLVDAPQTPHPELSWARLRLMKLFHHSIAAAFHAAQTGNYPPPSSESAYLTKPKAPTSKTQTVQRAQSPSEQLASAARALSPVRYFLRPTEVGDLDGSGEFNSFASLGSGETSYDYRQEEEFVRAAQAAAKKGPRGSDPKRRRLKAAAEDLPYRPAEDDHQSQSEESDGEGEGIVRNGALEGRADTRGKRAEKGEGYLGMGLGLQPRTRRKGRKSGDVGGDSESEDGMEERYARGHSPFADIQQANGHRRSPIPAQLLRALTPRSDRFSPAPGYNARKRQPSSLRTGVTNLLHGVATALRSIVELITGLLNAIVIRPARAAFGSGKQILRRLRQDWWKWIGGLIALSLALRILHRPLQPASRYRAPDVPPGSTAELVFRLTHLEKALSALSESSKAHEKAEKEGKRSSESILSRVGAIESSIGQERKRLDSLRQDSQGVSKGVQGSFDSLHDEVSSLTSRIDTQEKGLASVQGGLKPLDAVDCDVQSLKIRVDEVERSVKDALDDGRLRKALSRILPDNMLVTINSGGTIDIDPIFWTEMKKMLVGKGEVEELVRKMMRDGAKPQSSSAVSVKSEKELDDWAERLFERKAASGVIISRSDFIRVLEGEVLTLRQLMDDMPRRTQPAPPSRSSVTIKSSKGEDLNALFTDLIDAALLRYSKDTIARPDYGLFSAGGRVVPSITSDTLVMHSPSTFGRWVLGRKDVEGRSPATALHPDNSVGSCWPFNGDQGQLGVLLNRRVVVTDLTVEHAASEVALDVSTAPKNIEVVSQPLRNISLILTKFDDSGVWSKATRTRPKSLHIWRSNLPQSQRIVYIGLFALTPRSSSLSTTDHLKLASFSYDPSLPSHIQTFPVSPEIEDLGIDIGIIIFRVESNWGGEFTCLYRVSPGRPSTMTS